MGTLILETAGLKVATATIDDLDAIMSLQIAQNNAMAEAKVIAHKLLSKEDLRQQISHGLPLIVAKKDLKIVGFLSASSFQKILKVEHFYATEKNFEACLSLMIEECLLFSKNERYEEELFIFETTFANKFSLVSMLKNLGFNRALTYIEKTETKFGYHKKI
jgi:hypothetical protein